MCKSFFSALVAIVCLVSCSVTKKAERLVVASETADCVGVAPQKCLLIKRENHKDWEYLYTGIQGFDYEPGYEYVIEIRRDTVLTPPADASSIKYVLLKQVSKTQKQSEGLPNR